MTVYNEKKYQDIYDRSFKEGTKIDYDTLKLKRDLSKEGETFLTERTNRAKRRGLVAGYKSVNGSLLN